MVSQQLFGLHSGAAAHSRRRLIANVPPAKQNRSRDLRREWARPGLRDPTSPFSLSLFVSCVFCVLCLVSPPSFSTPRGGPRLGRAAEIRIAGGGGGSYLVTNASRPCGPCDDRVFVASRRTCCQRHAFREALLGWAFGVYRVIAGYRKSI